jgi:hypothetical protein
MLSPLLPYKPRKIKLVLPTTVDFVNESASIPLFFVSVEMTWMNGLLQWRTAPLQAGEEWAGKNFTRIKYARILVTPSFTIS